MSNLESEEVNIFDALASLYNLLKKNALPAVLIVVICIAGSIFLLLRDKGHFHSSIVIQTSLLSQKESEIIARQINFENGLTQQEFDAVEKFWFVILPNDPSDISASADSELLASLNASDLESGMLIQVSAWVKDSALLPKLEQTVVKLVSQNPLVKKRREERIKYFSKLIETIDNELRGLEQVKALAESKSYVNYLNPAELFVSTVALKKTRSEYVLKMEEISDVRIVKSFSDAISSSPPVKLYYIGGGLFSAAVLLSVYLFMSAFYTYYKNKFSA